MYGILTNESVVEQTIPNVNLDVNNPSHVLFLHPSDNPSNILVSELLNGENYGHWRKAMEIALISKNKLGFVLETILSLVLLLLWLLWPTIGIGVTKW